MQMSLSIGLSNGGFLADGYTRVDQALDLGNLAPFTIPDLSGNANTATQYTGIYVSTNGTTDKAINADCSAEGSGFFRITGWIKPAQTVARLQTNDESSVAITGLTTGVWQEFSVSDNSNIPPSMFRVGHAYNDDDPQQWTSADWSDIRLWRKNGINGIPQNDTLVAHWKLYDSAAASLDGYPALDCVGGYHGAHVGCAGGSGEGISYADPQNITSITVATAGYTTQTLTYYSIVNGKRAFRLYDTEEEQYHTILFGSGGVWLYYYAGGGYIRTSSDSPEYPWEATWDTPVTFSDYVGGSITDKPTILQTAGEDFNKRMWFDDGNDYVELGAGSLAFGSSDFEIEADIFVSSIDGTTGNDILAFYDGTGDQRSFIFKVDSSGSLYLLTNATGLAAGNTIASSNTVLSVGERYTVKVVKSGTTASFFVNGVSGGSGSAAATLFTPTLLTKAAIGINLIQTGSIFRPFHGIIYDLSVISGGVGVHEWLGNGNTDAAWTDQIGSNDGTVNGSPSLYHVAESETTAGQDALSNAIENPRPNERVANLDATDAQVTITDDASLNSLNVWAQWFYYDGNDGDIVDLSNGAGTTTIEVTTSALASTGLTTPVYYVGNKTTAVANTTTLTAGWNYIAVTFVDFTPTADLQLLRTGGHFIAYDETKVLADLEKNRAATKGQY